MTNILATALWQVGLCLSFLLECSVESSQRGSQVRAPFSPQTGADEHVHSQQPHCVSVFQNNTVDREQVASRDSLPGGAEAAKPSALRLLLFGATHSWHSVT